MQYFEYFREYNSVFQVKNALNCISIIHASFYATRKDVIFVSSMLIFDLAV